MTNKTLTSVRRRLMMASVALAALGAVAIPTLHPYPVAAEVAARGASLIGPDGSYAPLVRQDKPAIVTVGVTMKAAEAQVGAPGGMPGGTPPGMEEFFRRFFGDNAPFPGAPNGPQGGPQAGPGPMRGLGSGFIVSADGTIVTNNHVVGNAEKITVTLDDGREFQARLVGADSRTDIAVIKIDATDLPTVGWGDSDASRSATG